MTSRGDKIAYRSLSGAVYHAVVRSVRQDGLVDIGVEAGGDPLELSRIAIVGPDEYAPGTCTAGHCKTP